MGRTAAGWGHPEWFGDPTRQLRSCAAQRDAAGRTCHSFPAEEPSAAVTRAVPVPALDAVVVVAVRVPVAALGTVVVSAVH